MLLLTCVFIRVDISTALYLTLLTCPSVTVLVYRSTFAWMVTTAVDLTSTLSLDGHEIPIFRPTTSLIVHSMVRAHDIVLSDVTWQVPLILPRNNPRVLLVAACARPSYLLYAVPQLSLSTSSNVGDRNKGAGDSFIVSHTVLLSLTVPTLVLLNVSPSLSLRPPAPLVTLPRTLLSKHLDLRSIRTRYSLAVAKTQLLLCFTCITTCLITTLTTPPRTLDATPLVFLAIRKRHLGASTIHFPYWEPPSLKVKKYRQ